MKEAHLERKSVVKLDDTSARAFKLTDIAPKGVENTPKGILEAINFLDVENSKRYARNKYSTFCNIYAYDYATVLGAYLPRVFWTKEAIKNGLECSKPKYGDNVYELSANSLYRWFGEYSKEFNWTEVTMEEAQELANSGSVVIGVAGNKVEGLSGHIVAVIPENGKNKAKRNKDKKIISPLMSQAGAHNKKQFSSVWWKGLKPVKFYAHNKKQKK